MRLGLHCSIILKVSGIVIWSDICLLLDFKYIKVIAIKAEGAVIWRLTFGPYLILEHLLSLAKLLLIIVWGGSIIFPPYMNLISLLSSCKSSKWDFWPALPKQIKPKAHPEANEYPYLSKLLSLLGLLPIWDNVI